MVCVTPVTRRRRLQLVGRAIEELITMVTPGTFYRWCRDVKKATTKTSKPKGGQRKPRDLRKLVLWVAQETNFGLTRILGELRKLGIKRISRQTVRNILKEESIPPQPDRPTDRWDKFLRRHGETLWGCDFFTVRTITRRGVRQCYLLVFLNLKTREAIVSPATEHPNSKWVSQQATAFIEATASRTSKPSIVLHDRDTKFTRQFKDTLKNAQVRPSALPKASPNLNGRTERFGGSLKRECLSKFIFFGKQHLDYVVSLYVDYYNEPFGSTSRFREDREIIGVPHEDRPF